MSRRRAEDAYVASVMTGVSPTAFDPIYALHPVPALMECLRHLGNKDRANSATHRSRVKYSPLTFLVARSLDASTPPERGSAGVKDVRDFMTPAEVELLDDVLAHHGTYEEDRGR